MDESVSGRFTHWGKNARRLQNSPASSGGYDSGSGWRVAQFHDECFNHFTRIGDIWRRSKFMESLHKRGIAETMPLLVQFLCDGFKAGSEEAEQLRFVNHLHALDIVAVFEQGNNTVSHNIQV